MSDQTYELFKLMKDRESALRHDTLPTPPADRAFDGQTYEPERDHARMAKQMRLVFDLMKDGRWRTLGRIRMLIERGTEAAVSARLRDLRKPKYGSHTVEKRCVGNGLFEYRLILNTPQQERAKA